MGSVSNDRQSDEQNESIEEYESNFVHIFGRSIPKSDLFKLLGLLAFFLVSIVAVVAVWPFIGELFEEGGVERVIAKVQGAGAFGVCILLAMQLLQIIVAFIPGEVVQIAAGMLYGPWFGALIILVGCFISSFIIYQVVHRLGQPFVEDMVSTKHLARFREFEKSGKLDIMVIVLFLIPGLPKDIFTYLVPLTEMPLGRYLAITTLARIPGVVMSTLAASGLAEGNLTMSIVVFAIVGVIALLGIVFRERIMALGGKRKDEGDSDGR